MNEIELKSNFYKRYNEGQSMLMSDCAGVPCDLLGEAGDMNTGISCCLSMDIRAVGRKIGGNIFKIQNTSGNICKVMQTKGLFDDREAAERFISAFSDGSTYGAEILYDSRIPVWLDADVPRRAAMIRLISRLNDCDLGSIALSKLCAEGKYRWQYMTALETREKTCLCRQDGSYEALPLPLDGFKLLCMKPKRQKKHMKKEYARILSQSRRGSKDANMKLSDFKSGETDRVKKARKTLLMGDLREFAKIVNSSQTAAAELINIDREILFLIKEAMNSQCLCARFNSLGAYAIVSDELADNAVNAVYTGYEDYFGTEPVICVADSGCK